MRKAVWLACLAVVVAASAGVARASEPTTGTLSIEGGKGAFTLEVRGSMLGTLTLGSIVAVDRTPSDPYGAIVTGRRLAAQRRLGPAKVMYRGQGLRFRMVGGSYRVVIRGVGLALSAVGRGTFSLDGEPPVLGGDMGVYALNGADCSSDPASCTPIPDDPVRLKLQGAPENEPPRSGSGTR